MNLSGVVDLHLHSAPDVRRRSIDDLTVAREAVSRGLAGVLLKNHHSPTAARAAVARLAVPGAPIYGGVVLNDFVGGLNPHAVDAAAWLGGRAVWLPTFSAANHRRCEGERGGIEMLSPDGRPTLALRAVLEAVARHNVLLCTGHLSAAEVMAVVPAAREYGVQRILIQHAEHAVTGLTLDQQRALAQQGAFLERCFAQPLPDGAYARNVAANAVAIHAVGVASTVIASDLGQPENPTWPDGLALYLEELIAAGLSERDLDVTCRHNPAALLGVSAT